MTTRTIAIRATMIGVTIATRDAIRAIHGHPIMMTMHAPAEEINIVHPAGVMMNGQATVDSNVAAEDMRTAIMIPDGQVAAQATAKTGGQAMKETADGGVARMKTAGQEDVIVTRNLTGMNGPVIATVAISTTMSAIIIPEAIVATREEIPMVRDADMKTEGMTTVAMAETSKCPVIMKKMNTSTRDHTRTKPGQRHETSAHTMTTVVVADKTVVMNAIKTEDQAVPLACMMMEMTGEQAAVRAYPSMMMTVEEGTASDLL